MSSPYVLYNATLKRVVPYSYSMRNPQEARYALHHLTQRKKSCILLIDLSNGFILGVRVSQQSKRRFPRNYFKNNCALLDSANDLIVVLDYKTGEVLSEIPVSEL